jgi:hypothetical protein
MKSRHPQGERINDTASRVTSRRDVDIREAAIIRVLYCTRLAMMTVCLAGGTDRRV